MRLYRKKETLVFDYLICDKCGRKITDPLELQEAYSIQFSCGYASVFGDGNVVSVDFCQDCLYNMIHKYCRYE